MRITTRYLVALLGCSAMLGPVSAQAQAAPEATVMATQFRFTGNSVLSNEELNAVLRHFVDRQLTLEQLNRAAEEVQSQYRYKGYFLARAYLPPQTPTDGIVEIAILEGRIDKVSVTVAPDAPISGCSEPGFMKAWLSAPARYRASSPPI